MAWTKEEMRDYALNRLHHPILSSLYISAKDGPIPSSNPEARKEYLSEEVLKLPQPERDLLKRTTKKKGRFYALNLLEQWAIASFD